MRRKTKKWGTDARQQKWGDETRDQKKWRDETQDEKKIGRQDAR